MSRIKDLVLERVDTLIDLICRMEACNNEEVIDAWCTLGLPCDKDDLTALLDFVVDEDLYAHTIKTAEEFLVSG